MSHKYTSKQLLRTYHQLEIYLRKICLVLWTTGYAERQCSLSENTPRSNFHNYVTKTCGFNCILCRKNSYHCTFQLL